MEINKVVYNGDTLLDLTSDTVTPQTLLSGATAHAANGQSISGTVDLNGKADKVANATAGNFAGLDANGNLTDSGKSASDFDNVWLGTRAEHTAASAAGTLPETAIIGITDESAGGDNIQVFKSTDFEPITYTYSSSVTYRYPRVTFNGTKNGKILGIRYVDSNGKNRSLIGVNNNLNIKHFGANLFFSWGANKSSTNYGVTITHLGKGKYQVQGTAAWSGSATSQKIQIGSLPGSSYTSPVTPIGSDDGTILKIFNLQGEYNGLKIAIANESYDNACRLDEIKSIPRTTSSTNVYLYLVKGETYDCTFDLQITAINDMGSTDVYEAPFAMITGAAYPFCPFATAIAYPGSFKVHTYQTSSSTTSYYVEGAGNMSGFGIIDYPLVHCGKNTIVAGDYNDCSGETLPTFEVYYSEDFRMTTKDKLAEVEYSIVDGHFSKAGFISGSFQASSTPGLKYLKINGATWANPDSYTIPNGVWVSYSKTASQAYRNGHSYSMFSTDDYNQFVNRSEGGTGTARSLYVPKSEFYFHTDGCIWVPIPDSLTNGSTYYYAALPDWEGFDDSVN